MTISVRHRAALKAWKTIRAKKSKNSERAKKAWKTIRIKAKKRKSAAIKAWETRKKSV